MFTKIIVSAVLLAFIGLGISSCSTSDQGNSGAGMVQSSPPTGGGY